MKSDPNAIDLLVSHLSRLPGVGEKTARRFAFHILNAPPTFASNLAEAIITVRERIKLCSTCCNLTEADPCPLCTSPRRNRKIICVVERPTDIPAIERTGEFSGMYHVLHGVIDPLAGIGPDDLKLPQLMSRLGSPDTEEVIIATNPSVNGEATAIYIQRVISPLGIVVSRIALGVPIGSDIEFVDKVTLARALSGRRPLSNRP